MDQRKEHYWTEAYMDHEPKNKHKRRNFKKYRGQGKR